jgi:hypothetical protein
MRCKATMDSNELLAYRKQIIDDAIRMEKRPDRTPHFSNYWTWPILDSGYKLSEALHDWDIMEKIVLDFQRDYPFDLVASIGIRNPVQVIEPIGRSRYKIDDSRETINIADVPSMNADEYDLLLDDFKRFLWENLMPRRFVGFTPGLTIEGFGEVISRFNTFGQYVQRVTEELRNEWGVTNIYSYPTAVPGFEQVFNFLRGIKGTSHDLRRNPDKLKAACEFFDARDVDPLLAQLQRGEQRDDALAFDMISIMLGHNILSIKQWETFYWPSLKRILDAVVKADKKIYIFAEGSTSRFWDYLKSYPKGHIAIHIEQDDLFEFRKALPNICIVGGMPTSFLGEGTKEQCISCAKRLIDELGAEGGFILSQDKMISYRNDTKRENLKAVCNFVSEYR